MFALLKLQQFKKKKNFRGYWAVFSICLCLCFALSSSLCSSSSLMESVCESAFKILNRIFSVILNFVGPFLVTLCCLLITGINLLNALEINSQKKKTEAGSKNCLDFSWWEYFTLLRNRFEFSLGIVFVHYSVVVPFYTSYWTLSGILHFVISTFITVNIVYNYYKAVTTSPGSPPQVQLTAEQLEKLRNEPTPQRGQGFSRFCKVCMLL